MTTDQYLRYGACLVGIFIVSKHVVAPRTLCFKSVTNVCTVIIIYLAIFFCDATRNHHHVSPPQLGRSSAGGAGQQRRRADDILMRTRDRFTSMWQTSVHPILQRSHDLWKTAKRWTRFRASPASNAPPEICHAKVISR